MPLRLVLKVNKEKKKDKKEENAPVFRLWKETIGERRKNNAFRANHYYLYGKDLESFLSKKNKPRNQNDKSSIIR